MRGRKGRKNEELEVGSIPVGSWFFMDMVRAARLNSDLLPPFCHGRHGGLRNYGFKSIQSFKIEICRPAMKAT
jgi:hypothetical protein